MLTSKGLGNLPNIKVLVLSGNQFLIIVMHHLNFPLVEKKITESYMICCLFKAKDVICTAKQNVSTCNRLINNTFLLIVTWISGLFITLLNVLISLQYFM